ncbi:MAG: hypothetical protein V2I46_14785 [Bacteroides sp.]|nr:hypothetical protein [Bacteroides sp.]
MGKKRSIFIFMAFALTIGKVSGQGERNWSREIGINLLQLPATALDLTYEMARDPQYSISMSTGYTLNYSKSFDWLGWFMSPHYKCGNNGFSLENQSGGFLKAGLIYNFRHDMEKKNYFFLGGFLTGSWVFEKAAYRNPEVENSPPEALSQNVFIPGFTAAAGYNFRISGKWTSGAGFQVSFPSGKYLDLYGYQNYIPGMGYMETCGNERIFPMLVFSLNYSLN